MRRPGPRFALRSRPVPPSGAVRFAVAGVLGCILAAGACGPDAPPPTRELDPEVERATPIALRGIETRRVVGREDDHVRPFRVVVRAPEIDHYPCTSCHQHPIGVRSAALDALHRKTLNLPGGSGADCDICHTDAAPTDLRIDCTECHSRPGVDGWTASGRSHLTIEAKHPHEEEGVCFNCHARENPGLLALQDGSRASMDEAYRLCRGCHFDQGKDWEGGAHGKRVAAWRGERVVLSCTGCHNPHSPAFPQRPPVSFPKIPRRGH